MTTIGTEPVSGDERTRIVIARPILIAIALEPTSCHASLVPKTQATALRAVLFTDVVGSTELAREMGDVRWSRLLAAQRRVIRARLKARGGREVDTAGDGFFAVFDRPADAVRCAFEACRDVQELGLDIRGGVHFGEVEMVGPEVHGIVVHTGARVMGQAGASEVRVTATVKDLVAGARFDLQERETVQLKGARRTRRGVLFPFTRS
jgi:class 3 adenylate cyclase